MTTLVLGCSYTDPDQAVWHDVLFDDYKVYAKGGVDNEWIARTGVHALLNNKFDSVFVMFTGLNRISIPTPVDAVDPDYYFNFPVGYDAGPYSNVHLVQSGGLGGTWNSYGDKHIQDVFKKQYTTNSKTYFSDLNMYHVVMFVAYLQQMGIDFKWTFIYNIFSTTEHEHLLGQCYDRTYWNAIDKTNYIPVTPYEFGIQNNFMQEDGFHLTYTGQRAWAEEVKKYL